MKRCALVCLIVLGTATAALAGLDDFLYCSDYSKEYREVEYWARTYVSVTDYETGSGDSEALKLIVKGDNSLNSVPKKEIADHFVKEFNRLVKGSLPYHNVDAGSDKRLTDFIRNSSGNTVDLVEAFRGYEQARNRSLYGSKPAAIFCNIRISRREFPVLYQMRTTVAANEEMINPSSGITHQESIGYSAPAYVTGELKKRITEHLTKIAEVFKKFQSCKPKN